MEIALLARGLETDSMLEEFVRTTVAFAAWRQQPRVERVLVRLDVKEDQNGFVRASCALRAETTRGRLVLAHARGVGVCEVVQDAADRLEAAFVALPEPSSAPHPANPAHLAA